MEILIILSKGVAITNQKLRVFTTTKKKKTIQRITLLDFMKVTDFHKI